MTASLWGKEWKIESFLPKSRRRRQEEARRVPLLPFLLKLGSRTCPLPNSAPSLIGKLNMSFAPYRGRKWLLFLNCIMVALMCCIALKQGREKWKLPPGIGSRPEMVRKESPPQELDQFESIEVCLPFGCRDHTKWYKSRYLPDPKQPYLARTKNKTKQSLPISRIEILPASVLIHNIILTSLM